MGEYEPNDSRNVTLKPSTIPGEPPRTGPREHETREQPDGEQGDRADEPERSSIQQARGGPLDPEAIDSERQEQAGERGSGSLEDSQRQQLRGVRS